MIKKLRIKLIATSMVSLFLVLFVIGGIVGIINHEKIVADADRILDILEENDGTFPRMEPRKQMILMVCRQKFHTNPDIFLFCMTRMERLF